MEDDSKVLPPKSPVTVKLNQAVLDFVFWHWVKKCLPGYGVTITSGYRTNAKNGEVGGAANSAHLHGLAYDFVYTNPAGKIITIEQARDVYQAMIEPYWPGFSLFEVSPSGVWHVHVNLSRHITTYMGMAGVAVIGAVGYKVAQKLGVV